MCCEGRGDPPFLVNEAKKMNCITLDFAKKTARKMKRETGENYCVVDLGGGCWDVMRAVDAILYKILYTTDND